MNADRSREFLAASRVALMVRSVVARHAGYAVAVITGVRHQKKTSQHPQLPISKHRPPQSRLRCHHSACGATHYLKQKQKIVILGQVTSPSVRPRDLGQTIEFYTVRPRVAKQHRPPPSPPSDPHPTEPPQPPSPPPRDQRVGGVACFDLSCDLRSISG